MKLDKSQKKFCESSAERIRLLAPAGSGKTLSLLWRCKAIQEANPKKPNRFLVVTFTRSARDELKARISGDPDLRDLAGQVQVATLNALGYRHLRGQQTGLQMISKKDAYWVMNNVLRPLWSNNPAMASVLSSVSNLNIFKSDILETFDILKELGFRHDANNLVTASSKHQKILSQIGLDRYFRNSYLEKIHKMKLFSEEQQKGFLEFWAAATDHLNQSNFLTFADQKYWAMLKMEKATVAPNQRFHHILVDEFQDVDPLDMNFIKVLVSKHDSTLTIVGDDDQAIFEWRGAVPKFILEPESFLGGEFETHILGTNYRSPANIVEHSQKLIKNNEYRVDKDVKPKNRSKAEIVCREFQNYGESCAFVMDLVREMHGNLDGHRLAIMGRKRAQIIPYQIMLASEHIPFYAKEDLNIFLQTSFDSLQKTIVAISRRDDRRRRTSEVVEDFMLLVNNIKKHPLGKKEGPPLRAYLNNCKPKTLVDALEMIRAYDGSLKGGIDVDTFCVPIRQILETDSPADTLAILSTCFKGFEKNYGKAQSLEDIFYVDPPFLHLADYAQRYGNDYDAFLDDLEEAVSHLQPAPPADTEEDRDADEDRPIHLMTALRAKGKEYHTVVILDAINGIWPSKLAESPAEREQERRLFYVAVTRPKERLFVIANKTMLGEYTTPSPYIEEMELITSL